MNFFQQRSRFISTMTLAGFLIFAVPVTIATGAAIWLTAAAAYENVRFVRGTDQMLSLIGLARGTAAANSDFGQKPDEDLIDALTQRGQLVSPVLNSWKGEIRALVHPLPFMRIETDLPAHVCRRMASFFGKDASALRLQKMEAHNENSTWQTIYDATVTGPQLDYQAISEACGEGRTATLAFTFQLR